MDGHEQEEYNPGIIFPINLGIIHFEEKRIKPTDPDEYYYPKDPQFVFGKLGEYSIKEGIFRRAGNVVASFGTDSDPQGEGNPEGTLYISSIHAWVVVDNNGYIVASGSGGFPNITPITHPKPKEIKIETPIMVVKEQTIIKKSRFEDIIT
jgi:hypothetical protein